MEAFREFQNEWQRKEIFNEIIAQATVPDHNGWPLIDDWTVYVEITSSAINQKSVKLPPESNIFKIGFLGICNGTETSRCFHGVGDGLWALFARTCPQFSSQPKLKPFPKVIFWQGSLLPYVADHHNTTKPPICFSAF